MLVAIISDIHDNLANLKTCLAWLKKNKIEKIICLGDVTTIDTIDYLAANFNKEIILIKGNCEIYDETSLVKYKNLNYCGEIGITEVDGIRIGMCHQRYKIIKVLELSHQPLEFIFYGHSHKPWIENRNKSYLANPGNLAGVFHQATFATLDTKTKKLELKVIANLT